MTTVRIAHAEPRPGRLANGEFQTRGHLVVLADDAGHRAVPIWMRATRAPTTWRISWNRPADQVIADGVPQELTTRLLGAARARVTGVDIDVTEAGAAELSPEVTVARIGLASPAGTRQVTADLGLGLALAAAAGAPVRLPDAVLDRLAVPVPGDDLLTPFLDRVPPVARARPGHGLPDWPLATLPGRAAPLRAAQPGLRRGLDRWDLDPAGPTRARPGPGSADGERTTRPPPRPAPRSCPSAVPRPDGFAALAQEIFADDYRGATVTFRGQFRTPEGAGRAGLFLRVMKPRDLPGPSPRRPPWPTRPTTSSPSKVPATGPPARSPRRSRTTPTPSRSASSWSARPDRAARPEADHGDQN